MPAVSIIIPNYNHEAFLARRIHSVLGQSYTDFELIILDDCSSDKSISVIEPFRTHPKVSHVLYNEKNSGSGFKQWEKGINLAKGKFIWIAESDDYSEPDFLETMMELLAPEKNCKIAFAGTIKIDVSGNPTKPYDFKFGNGIDSEHDWVSNGKDFCCDILCKYNVLMNASSVVFEKELYTTAGGINTSYRICSDWLLWWEMISRSNIGFCSRRLNYYCIHESNTSSNWLTELVITYRYILTNWPFVTGKEEYKKYMLNYSKFLHRQKDHKTAYAISKLLREHE
ncbi:MAG: glycosyltransferase [Bacteroidota bacterium]|nr:glycosyltransferase [Bacteroidota bacterium]